MTDFKILVNIDSDLWDIVKEIERYFKVTLDKESIENIFKDSEDDQVNQKEYSIFEGKKKIFNRQIVVRGTVDESEPETIWIEIKNIEEKDLKHFNQLVSGKGHVC